MAGIMACSGSSSTTLPPTTGILIRAETLTAGHGCGPATAQLFKYVVVVSGYRAGDPAARASYQSAVTSNIFDCYTDGAFISLPASDDNATFRLEVFAYNSSAYAAAQATLDAASVIGRGRSDADRARLMGFSNELRGTAPTWTTECMATQQQQVQALASCDPLRPGLGGLVEGTVAPTTITLDTARFNLPGGQVAACATAALEDGGVDGGGNDAGLDAEVTDGAVGPGDGGDAADAGASGDGGATISFAKVRVRTRVGARIVADTILACPLRYSIEVPTEPARYDLDVGLLDAAENLVDPGAQTVCTATSAAGATSSAVCP
jgi:hypothetical protein